VEDYSVVRADFNEIALLEDDKGWNHNNCYFNDLLKHLPGKMDVCLDIGCGKGELSRLLATRAKKVISVDLAENMINRAKKINPVSNIEYVVLNALEMPFEAKSLNAIVTTATAHHLPYEWLLTFAKRTLKPGGRLIILDLANADTLADKLVWGFAFFPDVLMNILKNGRLKKDDAHAAAV